MPTNQTISQVKAALGAKRKKDAGLLTVNQNPITKGSGLPAGGKARSQALQNNAIAENRVAPGAGSTLAQQEEFSDSISDRYGVASGVPGSDVASSTNRLTQIYDLNKGQGVPTTNTSNLKKNIAAADTVEQKQQIQATANQTRLQEDFIKNFDAGDDNVTSQLSLDLAEKKARLAEMTAMGGAGYFGRGYSDTQKVVRDLENKIEARRVDLGAQRFKTDVGSQTALQSFAKKQEAERSTLQRQAGAGGVSQTMAEKRLGLRSGEYLYFNPETANYEVRTGDIEDSDPIVRAENRLQEDKDNAIADVDKAYADAIARAEANVAQYGSGQAKRNLAKLLKDKADRISKIELQADRGFEDLILQEEKRQATIEEALLSGGDQRELTTAERKELEFEVWADEQRALDPTVSIEYLENKYAAINKYEAKDPNAKANIKTWETKLANGEIDTSNQVETFQSAVDLTGDSEKAFELLKTTGNTEVANEFRSAWTEKKYGVPSPEIKEFQDLTTKKNNLLESITPDFNHTQASATILSLADSLSGGDDELKADIYREFITSGKLPERTVDFLSGKIADINRDIQAKSGGQFEIRTVGKTLLRVNPSTGESEVLYNQEPIDEGIDSDAIVEGILNSRTAFDIADVPLAQRVEVANKLSARQAEMMSDGTIESKLRASAGGRAMNATEVSQIAKAKSVINQLESLGGKLTNKKTKDVQDDEGNDFDISPLTGWLSKKNPWDTNAQEIEQILNSTIPNLARGVYGEVGVLTNQDVELYKTTIPNLRQTDEVKRAVMGLTLRTVKNQIENQLSTLADSGANVSGFVSTLDEVNRQIADIETGLGIVSPEVSKNMGTGITTGTDFSTQNYDELSDDELFEIYQKKNEQMSSFQTKKFANRDVTLEPSTMDAFSKANEDFKKDFGQDIKIGAVDISSTRTQEQQYALYGKGRTAEQLASAGVPVKYARPSEKIVTQTTNSRHMSGRAIDLYPLEIEVGGEIYQGKSYADLVKPYLEKHGIKQDAAGIGDYVNFEKTA